LAELNEQNQFEVFEAWSFVQQYNAQNRVRSDPEFREAAKSAVFTPTAEQRERYRELTKSPPVWQRPKAEEVAKRMNLQFLYKFGYDPGSRHVHPMANDGQQDFYTITKLEPEPNFPDQRSALSNTILFGAMIVQEGLNASDFRWRALVYDFLSHLLQHLQTGARDYQLSFVKLAGMFENEVDFCEPNGG
jgi:hypothetical protein